MLMLIVPAQMHINLELLFSAGAPHTITVGAPGVHGASVAGMQGIGVSTPSAAAVAAATIGLAGLRHMPKGGMLTIGMWSRMFAANTLLVITVFGVGMSMLGATPCEHIIVAFMQT
jgi:hypothetical protein